ncbi:hypothetical protein [Caballeronia sp. Lep1P3]|uniref:hypothetical protein n=1 Tax=Caballeronia sp. Lep1P3 TaxID=2878150 RepID=UPI001FD48664|nr:hypothetical protein [Caballeronia sp. Lep1P3]
MLVGNEYGVGVSNKGILAAQAGDLTLQSNGKLVLAGTTNSSGNVNASARDGIDNTGTTYAQGSVNASTSGALTNSGLLAAQNNTTINAASVGSTGTLAAGINGDGSLAQSGDLSVSASGNVSATGRNVAGGNATVSGSAVNLAGSTTSANNAIVLAANSGQLNLSGATTTAGSTLNARTSGTLTNDNGAMSSGGAQTVTAGALSNRNGQMVSGGALTENVSGATNNQNGTMQANGALSSTSGSFDNTGGHVTSLGADGVRVTTVGLLNNGAGGDIGGNGAVTITITDKDHQTQDVASLNRDTADLNGTVSKLPDLQNLLNQQASTQQAAAIVAQTVATQIGNYAERQKQAAEAAGDQATADKWKEGGEYRIAMHIAGGAAVAGLGGGSVAGGAAGAGVSAALAGNLNDVSNAITGGSPTGNADADRALGNIIANVLATGAGAAVGGGSGAAAGSAVDMYNAEAHCTNLKCEGSTPGSISAGIRNGVVSIAEMAVNLPNGGPFATPGDPGYISLDGLRVPYAAGDQIGPGVEFFAAVLATRGVGKGAAAEAIVGDAIQFGKVENQISHTFRHIEGAGFDRQVVQNAIQSDLSGIASSLPQGQYTGSVVVNGAKLDYSAFKLPDGTVNVGRITPPRTK